MFFTQVGQFSGQAGSFLPVAFPLDGLPEAMGFLTRLNPLSYGVDGLRGTLTGAAHIGIMTDLIVLTGVTVIVGTIGSYLFSRIEV